MFKIYMNVITEAENLLRIRYPEFARAKGRPSTTIVDEAERIDVDLIMMGSRGLGSIAGWILGSTSRRVVDDCKKPVLIVK